MKYRKLTIVAIILAITTITYFFWSSSFYKTGGDMIFFATFTTLMTLCVLTYARFNAGKKQGFLLMIALGGLVGQLTGFLSYFPYAAFVNGEALRTSNFSELLQAPFMAASVSLCWLIGSITFYICMTLPSEKKY